MSLRQAAQQALEALEKVNASPHLEDWHHAFDGEIDAIRAALAEPEQEPVAWGYELATTVGEHGYDGWSRRLTQHKPNVPEGSIRNLTPLYTAPTPRKPLTDEEVDRVLEQHAGGAVWSDAEYRSAYALARAVIAAYEAKNGTKEQT